jgi:hypothetical protein
VHVPQITKENALEIFPNPAKVQVTVKLSSMVSGSYTLTNTLGQVLLSGKLNGSTNNISISSIPKGVYSIKLTNEKGQVYTGKILKE